MAVSDSPPQLSVVIPAKNEQSIAIVADSIAQALLQKNISCEVIVAADDEDTCLLAKKAGHTGIITKGGVWQVNCFGGEAMPGGVRADNGRRRTARRRRGGSGG